ncbi:MAG: cytochrome c oxidase accessory protein CcoG [Verrucomicrobiota bacterium]
MNLEEDNPDRARGHGPGPARTPPATPDPLGEPAAAPARDVDWRDFREHLATAAKDGSRRWLYPKRPSGRFYRHRTRFSWLLLAVMVVGPFVRIRGNPLLMLNFVERKFSILGFIFWPEDTVIFAVAMLAFLTSIILFTTAFGRLWCGWACPQTIMMEMVFRKVEWLIEGDGPVARALDAAPWTWAKAARKALKHALFLGLSFGVGNLLLGYIIGSDALRAIIRDDPSRHVAGLTFMVLFTLLFYAIFARFREQACTFICPYGRFQSALLDENTMVVAYDHVRGEGRGPWRRGDDTASRKASGLGDCVNCRQCVAVCPTGIDIRDGIQMECVNCTACIDACDAVMDKVGHPRGLVRHASLNGIQTGTPLRFTSRMAGYVVLLAALASLLLFLVFTRSDVETLLLRAPGGLYQEMPGGRIANLYTVKVVNKSSRDLPVSFRLLNVEGHVQLAGGEGFVVPKERLGERSLVVDIEASRLAGRRTPLVIGIFSGERELERVQTVFVGPGA